LVDSRGNALVLEGKKLEITDKPVKVYNFKWMIFILIMLHILVYWWHNASSNYSNGMPEIKKLNTERRELKSEALVMKK